VLDKKNSRIKKIVNEGLTDETGGAKYYTNLVKKLKKEKAPKSVYGPFEKSHKDEDKHHKRLEKLRKKL
jgi:hypothetical protein